MLPWQMLSASDHIAVRITAYSAGQQCFSWRELNEKINETAVFLRANGARSGSNIALCGKNGFSLLLFYLSAVQMNMRVLGVNPAFPRDKIERICAENRIEIFVDCREVSHPPRIVRRNIARKACVPSTQPYTLTLTSGSSGAPKAAVHDIAAHSANAEGVCALTQFTRRSSWLLSLPLYHVSGQGVVWRWLSMGAELHLPGDDFYYSVTRATHVSLVPTQLQRLLTYLADGKISQFRTAHILLGGSQIPSELTERAAALGIRSYSGYGMTEMASTVFAKESDGKPGVGRPLPGREYRIVNEEIWLRGAGLARGYWRDGEIVPLINAQGWFQTKDKGRWTDNELVISGRADNMFISGGENIQPEEIERVLSRKENVLQAFVLPVSDAEFGQRPVAFVEFSLKFSTALADELAVWLSDKIERFKQPVAYYELNTDKFRRQGGIKISRALLKAELERLVRVC